MRNKKEQFSKLNTTVGCDELEKIWKSSEEHRILYSCEQEGVMAELDGFSSYDNPYSFFSPEWISWNIAYFTEIDRRIEIFQI